MIENKVIVFGGSHHNTLGVVRSLGEKGIKSFVVIIDQTLKNSFVLKSKYIEDGVILKSYDEGIKYISRNLKNNQNKSIVICTSDKSASYVDLNYSNLCDNFIIPNAKKEGRLTYLMNKEVMSNLAKKNALNVADTWVINGSEIVDEIQYPCITKPLISMNGSKSDIRICQNKIELSNILLSKSSESKIQVQKYIDKLFEYQLIGCALNSGETIIIPGYTKIITYSNIDNTGFLEYLPISDLEFELIKCQNFIKDCNYSGLFSMEFLRGKDDKDYFLEINFRNDGNAYAVTAAGVNLPYIWVASHLNIEFSNEVNQKIKPILVMPELFELIEVLLGNISLIKWLKNLKNTEYFIYYNKNDKIPFYYELIRILLMLPNKLYRRTIKSINNALSVRKTNQPA